MESQYPQGDSFWANDTLRISCMCMNTFGILPDHIRVKAIEEMFRVAGPGGKMIIGCWHRESLRTGYEEFYSKNAQLCGECKESDFDFEAGNFVCSSSDYTSHWWTAEELKEKLLVSYPGDKSALSVSFVIKGIGIFAVCDIPADAKFTRD